ncbi:MAG: hypothetical protein CVV27_06270 [Candidatus Melainabacteria bacterium HGW-Melainabacteria-1]|nr:MAG: hypothetical protein CVV27_06270 [Candidatus Melainabacteria bacterium HGW-Melainabacteria-1]
MKLKGNYFGPEYLNFDVKGGMLNNTGGTRLIALSEDFLLGFRKALLEETGQAHHVVFETCGRTWGENLARRLEREISAYYEQPFRELPMSMFTLMLQECWIRHGWGELSVGWEAGHQDGLFAIKIENPAFSAIFSSSPDPDAPAGTPFDDDVFTGLLASLFTRFAARELQCIQIGHQRKTEQDPLTSYFVVGVPERLKPTAEWVRSGLSHEEIMSRLQEVSV